MIAEQKADLLGVNRQAMQGGLYLYEFNLR